MSNVNWNRVRQAIKKAKGQSKVNCVTVDMLTIEMMDWSRSHIVAVLGELESNGEVILSRTESPVNTVGILV